MEEDKVDALFAGVEVDLQLLKEADEQGKVLNEELPIPMIDKFETFVAKQPRKPFLIYDDLVYTYEAIDNLACRVANIAKTWNLQRDECVAIMIQNEPSFIYTFFGLQKLGIPMAFINTNLTAHALVHSIKVSECKTLIVGSGKELLAAVTGVLPQLDQLPVYVQDVRQESLPSGMKSFDDLMRDTYSVAISPTVRSGMTMDDTCCFIYTSGTTGNPKPVFISQTKANLFSCLSPIVLGVRNDDISYIVIPLYHSTGFFTAFSGALIRGATVVLRKKFSASNFWKDCRKYKVTIVTYVGELMRYLVTQPKSELDGVHNIRGCVGNGLRAEVWVEMKERFKIPRIAEFWGATDGFVATFNTFGKPGCIGRLSPLLRRFDADDRSLIKYDVETGLPIRDEKGRCIRVKTEEPGLMISKLPDNFKAQKFYKGDPEATEKKLLRDVFVPGDIYVNFGDALILDKDYYLYFYDRLGDTFRWRSENVSTREVANAICSVPFVEDANVYGVKVPGYEGRAGMVAINLITNAQFGNKELQELYKQVCKELPVYARPLFVRHIPEAAITGTFKNKKVDLAKEGYDLNIVRDPLYFLDNENQSYSSLTKTKLAKFLNSKL